MRTDGMMYQRTREVRPVAEQHRRPDHDEMTVARAAKLTGISEARILEWVTAGKLVARPHPGPGGREQLLVSLTQLRLVQQGGGESRSEPTIGRVIPMLDAQDTGSSKSDEHIRQMLSDLKAWLQNDFTDDLAQVLHQIPTREELQASLDRLVEAIEALTAEVQALRAAVEARSNEDTQG